MQGSVVQCKAVHCSAVQCSAVQVAYMESPSLARALFMSFSPALPEERSLKEACWDSLERGRGEDPKMFHLA